MNKLEYFIKTLPYCALVFWLLTMLWSCGLGSTKETNSSPGSPDFVLKGGFHTSVQPPHLIALKIKVIPSCKACVIVCYLWSDFHQCLLKDCIPTSLLLSFWGSISKPFLHIVKRKPGPCLAKHESFQVHYPCLYVRPWMKKEITKMAVQKDRQNWEGANCWEQSEGDDSRMPSLLPYTTLGDSTGAYGQSRH